MLRDFQAVPYIPILALRPAEMNALQELPTGDLDRLLPMFVLRPWLSSANFSNSIERISEAYGDRPLLVNMHPNASFTDGQLRPAHEECRAILSGENGYGAWCDLIEANTNFIPAIQYGMLDEVSPQIERLAGLGRGVVLHLRRGEALAQALDLVTSFQSSLQNLGESLLIVLDYGQRRADLLSTASEAVGLITSLSTKLPRCHFAVSATTFPSDFVGVAFQEIYERMFHTLVQEALEGKRVIYADRGSARDESARGGGSRPKPRVDLPTQSDWRFFREEAGSYSDAATRAIESDYWDTDLKIWGTQMIIRTALGEEFGINSPVKSTATRINIHLHRQLFYSNPEDMYDTDEEWTG